MKLSWLAAVGAAIVLRATPVLSDDTTPHIPDNCSDIRIFSARGSNEPYPGRGGAMLGTLCWLFESAGVSCDYEDVSYPANISWSGIFCESANIGVYAGRDQMTTYVERFVAAVSFGSPRFTADQPYNIGRGSNYNGVLKRWGQQLYDLNEYEDIIAMWCNAGDPVCAVGSDPVNISAHWSYYDQYSDVASRWVVATALGQTNDIVWNSNVAGSVAKVMYRFDAWLKQEAPDQQLQPLRENARLLGGGLRVVLCDRPDMHPGMSIGESSCAKVESCFDLHPATIGAFFLHEGSYSVFTSNDSSSSTGRTTEIDDERAA
ncbi:hypothetical protein DV737_g5414, partial [Chaetothyriales sp. CBS 132003]